MSIFSDMMLYYRRTYLGYRDGETGKVKPFYVEECSYRSSFCDATGLYEPDEISDYLYKNPEAMKDALKFRGSLCEELGRTREVSIDFDDEDLIFEIPDLGYFFFDGSWRWLTYQPIHSAKKGLCPERLNQSRHIGYNIIFKLLNWEACPKNPHPDLLLNGQTVEYKGVKVGRVSENTITLKRKAFYIEKLIKEVLPNHEVIIEAA